MTKRDAKSDSTRIRTVVFFWRRLTGDDTLLFDNRWDLRRHWTGQSGPSPHIVKAAKQFWDCFINESFDFKEEEDDEEDIPINSQLR